MDVLTENITTDPCFASEKLGCARIRMANLTRDNFFFAFQCGCTNIVRLPDPQSQA